MLLNNLIPHCGDKKPSMLALTNIIFDVVRMDYHRILRLHVRERTQSSMSDASEESLLQNILKRGDS